jgi:hypothetical protein
MSNRKDYMDRDAQHGGHAGYLLRQRRYNELRAGNGDLSTDNAWFMACVEMLERLEVVEERDVKALLELGPAISGWRDVIHHQQKLGKDYTQLKVETDLLKLQAGEAIDRLKDSSAAAMVLIAGNDEQHMSNVFRLAQRVEEMMGLIESHGQLIGRTQEKLDRLITLVEQQRAELDQLKGR